MSIIALFPVKFNVKLQKITINVPIYRGINTAIEIIT